MKFNYVPGDFPNAARYWPDFSDGDGSGNLLGVGGDVYDEGIWAFEHMYRSGDIVGEYSGEWGGTFWYEPPFNVPRSSYSPESFYSLVNWVGVIYGQETKTTVLLGTENYYGAPWDSAITPKDAFLMDRKVDDGSPSLGRLLTVAGTEYRDDPTKCTDLEYWEPAGSANYVLEDHSVSCALYFYNFEQ